MNKKLYRDEYHKVLGGVCSGLADYFEVDVTVIRLLFAFTVIIMGVGIIPYIVLWIVLPKKDYTFNSNFNNPTVDYTVPPQKPADQFTSPPPPAGTFGGSPYSGNPFGGNPTGYVPPKQKSNAGVIVGVVLIILGAAILIDEYDLIPDFDFERLWPAVLVLVGGALIASGQKRAPWDKQESQNPEKKEETTTDNSAATDNTSTVES
jgi:phage shock protein C